MEDRQVRSYRHACEKQRQKVIALGIITPEEGTVIIHTPHEMCPVCCERTTLRPVAIRVGAYALFNIAFYAEGERHIPAVAFFPLWLAIGIAFWWWNERMERR